MKEAIILVDGSDQLAIATRSNPVPITGRNCQAPFGVQRDFGSPTKHDYCQGVMTALLTLNEPGTRHLPLSSHFSPLLATIFGP